MKTDFSQISRDIISCLPYAQPFLFVDAIEFVDQEKIAGNYTYKMDEPFYPGHFIQKSITPGVILIETLGQIGFVSFGIYLQNIINKNFYPLFSEVHAEFFEPVMPGEKVTVESELIFIRASYIRCKAIMKNEKKQIVLQGTGTCKFVIHE